MKQTLTALYIFAAMLGASLAHGDPALTHLSDLDVSGMTQGWGKPTPDASVDGSSLVVAGEEFDKGIGTHADSAWTLNLAGKGVEFRAKVGIQDGNPGEVAFIVRGDGKELFHSGAMHGGTPVKEVRVPLAGIHQLALQVSSLGSTTSDHADWLDPVIVHNGAPLPPVRPSAVEEPLLPDGRGEPENSGAKVEWNKNKGTLRLRYDGKVMFEGRVAGATLALATTRKKQAITQTITLSGKNLRLEGTVSAPGESVAAETQGLAQKSFPLIRTSSGASHNLRNNAIYDRTRDWVLAGLPGQTKIMPLPSGGFSIVCAGDTIELSFKPRFYQRHKNIAYFRPWTYQVRKDSITGWSSWWAYMRNCSQKDCDALLSVWKEKRFADYGYRFIQLDDCFQNEFGKGQGRVGYSGANTSYVARGPGTWLDWRKDTYPAGMNGYVAACKSAGFEPAIWIGSYITDNEIITQHPDWFIRDAAGKPFVAPWASCGIDATNVKAMNTLIRPTFKGVRQAGFSYVKVDLLRHYLYDNIHHNVDYCKAHGVTPSQMYRKYLGAIREELGPDTFLLSCWGVLPESVGLADACRIGGDGYGPMTMQQYNSWNGIVWRNDPDHCDVYPRFKPAQAGNVTKTAAVVAAPADTIIRPALASIAGCMLILSDKPAVYRDDANLAGLRRAAPVVFSVPGQLYDFEPSKTRNLISMKRTDITSGTNPTPIDADQFGAVCPWWLNEFDRSFEHWSVLHHLNWSGNAVPATTVNFTDVGLDPAKEYLVYEFWSDAFLGVMSGQMALPALPAMGLNSLSLREKLNHPQIVSTSSHLSQGGVDLVKVDWDKSTLSGRSRVVAGDRYILAIYIPSGFTLKTAEFAGKPAEVKPGNGLLRVSVVPPVTGELDWRVIF